MRHRETERQRKRDRERETERDIHTDNDRETEKDRDRQRQRQTETERDRHYRSPISRSALWPMKGQPMAAMVTRAVVSVGQRENHPQGCPLTASGQTVGNI